jgi:NTE family protein
VQLKDSKKKLVVELGRSAEVNIVCLICQKQEYEGHAQDYEFSGTPMRDH